MRIRRKPPKSESIAAKTRLQTYPDNRGAAGLFCRILKAVREQTAENRKKREAEKEQR